VNIEFSRRKILQPKRFAKGKNSYHYKKPIPNIPHPHPFTDHLLHLIQINHGNFPPRQVTRGQRGREGWGCWSGEEGGFRRMMTKIFRIVPCPGSSRKEEGEGGGGTDHLLHLIQIIHGNFPPRQVTRGGLGVLEWGGEGLKKNDDENFSYCPCPRSSRKGGGRGVFNAAGNRLRKFFVLNERERKFSATFY
jgi:hypothetical protein